MEPTACANAILSELEPKLPELLQRAQDLAASGVDMAHQERVHRTIDTGATDLDPTQLAACRIWFSVYCLSTQGTPVQLKPCEGRSKKTSMGALGSTGASIGGRQDMWTCQTVHQTGRQVCSGPLSRNRGCARAML